MPGDKLSGASKLDYGACQAVGAVLCAASVRYIRCRLPLNLYVGFRVFVRCGQLPARDHTQRDCLGMLGCRAVARRLVLSSHVGRLKRLPTCVGAFANEVGNWHDVHD